MQDNRENLWRHCGGRCSDATRDVDAEFRLLIMSQSYSQPTLPHWELTAACWSMATEGRTRNL